MRWYLHQQLQKRMQQKLHRYEWLIVAIVIIVFIVVVRRMNMFCYHNSSSNSRKTMAASAIETGLDVIYQYPIVSMDHDSTHTRQNEYLSVLVEHIQHPYISRIHLLMEADEDMKLLMSLPLNDTHNKLHIINHGRRMTYRDAFRYAQDALPSSSIALVLNADITIGEGFHLLSRHDINERLLNGEVFALSRWERHDLPSHNSLHESTTDDDKIRKRHECGISLCPRYRNARGWFLSHDAFVFSLPLPEQLIDAVDFIASIPGSENVLVHEMKRAGLHVSNPCLSLYVYHRHCAKTKSHHVNAPPPRWKHRDEERLDLLRCKKYNCGDGYVVEGITRL